MEPEAIQHLKASFRGVGTADAKQKAKELKLSRTDVVLASPRKNGNTWTEQILHGLRSGGDMDFDEISFVIPELEFASDYGYGDLLKSQRYAPRMFRTHLAFEDIPKGAGKYVVVVRDPHDAALSLYNYWVNWLFAAEDISADDLTEYFWLGHDDATKNMIPCQMEYIAAWYPLRRRKNVFWLHFEDLKHDLRSCVKQLAGFLKLDWQDDDLIDLVARQADISFMKMHQSKFDSHHIKKSYNVAMGLAPDAGTRNAKVHSGHTGRGKAVLSDRVTKMIDDRWKNVVSKKFGFSDYAEMRASINAEYGRFTSRCLLFNQLACTMRLYAKFLRPAVIVFEMNRHRPLQFRQMEDLGQCEPPEGVLLFQDLKHANLSTTKLTGHLGHMLSRAQVSTSALTPPIRKRNAIVHRMVLLDDKSKDRGMRIDGPTVGTTATWLKPKTAPVLIIDCLFSTINCCGRLERTHSGLKCFLNFADQLLMLIADLNKRVLGTKTDASASKDSWAAAARVPSVGNKSLLDRLRRTIINPTVIIFYSGA